MYFNKLHIEYVSLALLHDEECQHDDHIVSGVNLHAVSVQESKQGEL